MSIAFEFSIILAFSQLNLPLSNSLNGTERNEMGPPPHSSLFFLLTLSLPWIHAWAPRPLFPSMKLSAQLCVQYLLAKKEKNLERTSHDFLLHYGTKKSRKFSDWGNFKTQKKIFSEILLKPLFWTQGMTKWMLPLISRFWKGTDFIFRLWVKDVRNVMESKKLKE